MLKKIIIQADGDMYCATFEDFVDLQESNAGFGKTPMIALINLLRQYRLKIIEVKE